MSMRDNLNKMGHVLPEHTEQLVMLRQQASRFGMIHEAQTAQLKIWPRVLISHSIKSEARIDTEKFEVEIWVKTKGKAPKDHAKKLKFLADGIQWLLGDNWEVRIIENGGKPKVFKRTESAEDRYAGTDFAAGAIVPSKPWNFLKGK